MAYPRKFAKKKVRLDELLIQKGLFCDAEQVARALIAKEVKLDDLYVSSPALLVPPNAQIEIKSRKHYVSRGGYKLEAALRAFNYSPVGQKCIDIGSSTGGFTDCLLQHHAASVACVDVNYGQLAWKLRQDSRVKVFERCNIKQASCAQLDGPFDLLVADLSFIGLASCVEYFVPLCNASSSFIGLIKPQFESLHEETDRGVVTNPEVHARVIDEVKAALESYHFHVEGVCESPLKGPAGNIEFLIYARYAGSLA